MEYNEPSHLPLSHTVNSTSSIELSTMAGNSSQLSDFSLPAKVLNEIAGYVLVHGGIHPYRAVSAKPRRVLESTANPDSLPGIQLIVACKQAYHEDHTLFYSSDTFHLPPILMFLWSVRLQAQSHGETCQQSNRSCGAEPRHIGSD